MSEGASTVAAQGEPLLIPVRTPFDLRMTVSALRRLPHTALYPLVGEEWRFVAALPSGHRLLAVRAHLAGDETSAALECAALDGVLSGDDATTASALVAWMLAVERDLTPLHALVADDVTLAPLAQRLAGMKPPRFASLWEAFCQIVPFQQVSLSAAIATLNRFVMALGPELDYDGQRYWGVPTPQRTLAASQEELRACGLSAAKAQTLRGLAERALAGDLNAGDFTALADEAAIARLPHLPGIGRWSGEVALLRGLGRLSIFPAGDSGAARGLRDLYPQHAQPDAAAQALLERLDGWRGYLYFLLLGRRILATQAQEQD
jgi:DNA-3-methyladenine glycosylase II